MVLDETVDDRYTDGVYYDGSVGEFYTFERSPDGTSVTLFNPITDKEVETLSAEEFFDIQEDLYKVPQKAIDDPVSYYEEWASEKMANERFDAGLMWSDRATEVVNK